MRVREAGERGRALRGSPQSHCCAGAHQEWNPDLPHTTTKKEKQPKKAEGVTLTNATGVAESTSQAGDRGR